MKISHILSEALDDEEDISELIMDWENEAEGKNTTNISTAILEHPEAQGFKQCPAGVKEVYRAFLTDDTKVNKIKAYSGVVSYSTRIDGAHNFYNSLELYPARYIIIKKAFKSQACLLDFEAMRAELVTPYHSDSGPEYEVWMKYVPYYTKAKKSEIVYDSAADPEHGSYDEEY
tara:strand:+ start:584 stop:1105 length:522 start_codon:yes stop_codon:yes gene_type:complete